MFSPLTLLTVLLSTAAITVNASDFDLFSNREFVQQGPSSPMAVGTYYRPNGPKVSGFPDATTEYVRSPCPALNTLANHGYLPRDGKNITPAVLKKALEDVYNLDPTFSAQLTGKLNPTFSLASLSVHNFIEHDDSMVHADSYYQQDPATIDNNLLVDLLDRGTNGRIGVPEMGSFRKDRLVQCAAKPPGCDLPPVAVGRAYGESALLLIVLGDRQTESISVAHAMSFLAQEKIPYDYKKSATPITAANANDTAQKVLGLAPVQAQTATPVPTNATRESYE